MTINLHTTPSITIEQLLDIQGGIQIIIPYDETTLNSELVEGVKWKDIVSGDSNLLLSTGNLSYEVLLLKATLQQSDKVLLEFNNGYNVLLDLSNNNSKELVTRVSGESAINGNLQYCFTITKGVMRNETIAFLEEEYPGRSWEDVYGECIMLEAQIKPESNSIQILKDNWEKWGNHDIEFSNYHIFLNQQKENLKRRFGWSTNRLREINNSIRIIKEIRDPSSHQNLNDKVLTRIDSTIEAMKTIIMGFEKILGDNEVIRRCEQLEERRKIIQSIKERINN